MTSQTRINSGNTINAHSYCTPKLWKQFSMVSMLRHFNNKKSFKISNNFVEKATVGSGWSNFRGYFRSNTNSIIYVQCRPRVADTHWETRLIVPILCKVNVLWLVFMQSSQRKGPESSGYEVRVCMNLYRCTGLLPQTKNVRLISSSKY